MKTAEASRIKDLLENLCRIPSVSGHAEEENRCAEYIKNFFEVLRNNYPDRVKIWTPQCEGDALKRRAVFALLRAPHKTKRTIILTGHFDVVDTANCGELADATFDLEKYTSLLKKTSMEEQTRAELESGNWLFGRGSMDMKAGLALFMASMEKWAEDPGLKVNLLFWAVPDEEANSAGMIGSLRTFVEICEKENLQPVAALTGEPCFWTNGSKDQPAVRPYYTGTTGKMMPFFYAFGKSAHINDYLEGFSSALLISEIVSLGEADCSLYEGQGLDLLAPPVCLGLEIHRRGYSVTVPDEASAYFNVVSAQRNPQDVLRWATLVAAKASGKARDKLNKAVMFALDKGADFPDIPEVNVLPFRLLVKKAQEKLQDSFESEREAFFASLPKETDAREAALAECSWLFKHSGLPRPTVIVGFLPPYYPARINRAKSPEERKLKEVMEELVAQAQALSADGAVKLHQVFGGISDLSFLGFAQLQEGAKQIKNDMAGWGNIFSLPTDLKSTLDIPVANMGPAGKDAHQATERLELEYSLKIAPKLLSEAIRKLS